MFFSKHVYCSFFNLLYIPFVILEHLFEEGKFASQINKRINKNNEWINKINLIKDLDNNDDGKEGLEEAMRYRSFLIYIYAYMIIYVYIFILEYFYEIKYYHCPYTDLVGNNKPNFGCDLFTIDVLT